MFLPADRHSFLEACAHFATGVGVLTARDRHGRPHGMTVNSFTSVSLDPPLILVCIDHRSAVLPHVLDSKVFAINILGEQQKAISITFAVEPEGRFDHIEWHAGRLGAPILTGILAQLECTVAQTVEAGDHTVVIGNAAHVHSRDGKPLLYVHRAYERIG